MNEIDKEVKKEVKKIKRVEDRLSKKIGESAGTIKFVYLNATFYFFWILLNTGVFGKQYIIDPYPFIFLTFIVSLEAIFLSTFVLITQNRESRRSEISEAKDHEVNVKSELENRIIMSALERIATTQKIDVSDLVKELDHIADQELELHIKK